MHIRSANQQDSSRLADLVWASASKNLAALFNVGASKPSQAYLQYAFQRLQGQYGYGNHWVLESEQQVVASISAWHSTLTDDFYQASLKSVVEFFGLASFDVIKRSELIAQLIPKPLQHEWCIGHLAVLPHYQRKGIASLMLDFMSELAIKHDKTELSLDVEEANTVALAFYQHHGFAPQGKTMVSPQSAALGLGTHLHLTKKV